MYMYFNIRHTANKKKGHLWPSVTSAKRCALRDSSEVPESQSEFRTEKQVTKVVKP